MTHCEKCIHYDICESYSVLDIATFFSHSEDCEYFKSAADMREVRHAYWTGRLSSDDAFEEGFSPWFTEEDKKARREAREHVTHCSNCKGGYDDRTINSEVKYCKYCGAYMDGGK